MRAVIYARYSSDMQRAASIEDQLRLCRERIASQKWTLVQVFQDRAMSGASSLRPAYQNLLAGAQDGRFDVVVAEALDRLSRDQEDIAGLFKRLTFAGIRIVTLAEGEVNELHVGLKGTMNALFLKDLASKTHRGLRGRVEAGRSAGGLCYGYEVVRQLDTRGEPIRGERKIIPERAATVQRIFQMFADGTSPIAIAKHLNTTGLPGPEGRAWRDTTLRGHAGRGTGILRNELYIGRLVWNRMHFLKDPATGKRVSRMNPASAWITEEVEQLRIIPPELWERVQHRLEGIRQDAGADEPSRDRWWERRRAKHLLSGKCFCGLCGGAFSAIGKDYLACSAARRQGTCLNTRSIRRSTLEMEILASLQSRLMQPDLVAEFVTAFTEEWNRLQAGQAAASATVQRELEVVRRRLGSLIDAIADGMRSQGLQQKLADLEARAVVLEAQLGVAPAATLRLLPNLADVYRTKLGKLQDGLLGADGTAAVEAIRSLIEQVIIRPAEGSSGMEIELIGEIAAMMRLAQGNTPRGVPAGPDAFFGSAKVVAGTGFEPVTFRL